jgi:hypothetical protein
MVYYSGQSIRYGALDLMPSIPLLHFGSDCPNASPLTYYLGKAEPPIAARLDGTGIPAPRRMAKGRIGLMPV